MAARIALLWRESPVFKLAGCIQYSDYGECSWSSTPQNIDERHICKLNAITSSRVYDSADTLLVTLRDLQEVLALMNVALINSQSAYPEVFDTEVHNLLFHC